MAYLGLDPQVAYSSYRNIDDISGSFDGTTTSFVLKVNGVAPGISPINEQQVLINVGGVPQQPDPSGAKGFKLSAGNVVFSSAPAAGESFWGVILASANYASAGTIYTDGSQTAPSITFAAQTTTGLYRSGSNQLAVALNGINPVTFSTSGLQLNGSASGAVTVAAPAAAGNNTLTLPTSNGSTYQILRNGGTTGSLEFADKIVSGTAVASTSGTSIDFTGIPSWVKRVTVMFNEVSTSGTSLPLVQIGSGSVSTSGYVSTSGEFNGSNTTATVNSTAGFVIRSALASNSIGGLIIISLIGSNTWAGSHQLKTTGTSVAVGGGSVALSGTLDRVRITTTNGTDTFDAGSINILWE